MWVEVVEVKDGAQVQPGHSSTIRPARAGDDAPAEPETAPGPAAGDDVDDTGPIPAARAGGGFRRRAGGAVRRGAVPAVSAERAPAPAIAWSARAPVCGRPATTAAARARASAGVAGAAMREPREGGRRHLDVAHRSEGVELTTLDSGPAHRHRGDARRALGRRRATGSASGRATSTTPLPAPATSSSTCSSRAPSAARRWRSPPIIDAVGGDMNAFTVQGVHVLLRALPRPRPAAARSTCSAT